METRAARFTITLLVLAPILVTAVVVLLSRTVARPLARLSLGAAGIAAGDLTTRIDVGTVDEFGALAADFNAMAAALAEHQRRLVESEKLAGIGRLAAGLAHELNNPLQVVLGYLSLHRDVADPLLARHLGAVEVETLRCRDIVDGLGDFSRPATDAVAIELRSLCHDVAGRVRAAVPGALRMSIDGEALTVADPHKLEQVLFNLVKNAAEAAGPDGDVSVGIAETCDAVEVAVSDSGPGIPCDARDRLFEPFFTTKTAGTGLGLAVSRAIARAHGGDIDVRNGVLGGAVFTLRLPRTPEMGRSAT
jgi:signal transduction histidine kinase